MLVRALSVAALAATGILSPSCAVETAEDGAPCTGKCDAADDLEDALDGRGDPIARWIRSQSVASNGSINADFEDILTGVLGVQGCGASSVRTFVVSDDLISGDDPFPRLVSAVCADDAARASEFFLSASFEKFVGDGEPTGEIDTRTLEMFAWDEPARTYRFYATEPASSSASSGIQFEVEPARCRGCHLTPTDLAPDGMPMTPIMNELTRPWTHWNAEPGFPSLEFVVPERVADSDSYKELAVDHLGPASELEQIIRAGHDRVSMARMRVRRDSPPDLAAVMALLRPVFCEEQINYVSEDFSSGILADAALVDPGIRRLFLQSKASWPWTWVNDGQIRMSSTTSPVHQIPVRANVDTVVEMNLVALGVFTPMQLLQVRALDWQKPVFSTFRCGLWRDAQERFEDDPPDLSGATRNSDAADIVLDAIMTVDGTRITTGDTTRIIAVPVASATKIDALVSALEAGTLDDATCASKGYCALDLDAFGDTLDAYLTTFQSGSTARTKLKRMRTSRICEVLRTVVPADDRFDGEDLPIRFANRPSLPAVSCN